ncbi:MAG TPA: hypothetical protein VK900_16640 [Anaerolineales bacterium]|nr:hypothetical protein [Anaerolineales bacterium]
MANGGIPLFVKAPNGTDLRREPHANPKTKDGEVNLILLLPKGTYIRLENQVINAVDKKEWALVTLQLENKTMTGWVIADDLGLPAVQATPPPVYKFRFGGKKYRIFKDKLSAAQGQYIFRTRTANTKRVTINGIQYFTAQDKIDAMKSPEMRWIMEG